MAYKHSQNHISELLIRLMTIVLIGLGVYVKTNWCRRIDDIQTISNQRVKEGDSAILSCFFSPSNANIGKWYWKANGTVIIRSDDPPDPNSRYSLGDAVSGNVSLGIKNVLRWDNGTFTCGVNDQSTGSTIPISIESKLTVDYLDNPKLSAETEHPIIAGAQVIMECNANSSYVYVITWFHEDKMIKSASGKYSIKNRRLQIHNFSVNDEGNYSCMVGNKYFTDGKYSNSLAQVLSPMSTKAPIETAKTASSSNTALWIISILMLCFLVGQSIFLIVRYRLRRPTLPGLIQRRIYRPIQISHKLSDSIAGKDAIYRVKNGDKYFIRPIGLVFRDDNVFLFGHDETDNEEGYIMCEGKLSFENNKISITWSKESEVLFTIKKNLCGIVVLPGIHHRYIFLGYVSQDRQCQGQLVSVLADGTVNKISKITKTFASKRPYTLKLDPHSGKKLSTGRLVVGGWIKCKKCDYEPFIMYTDDENLWNLGEGLKIKPNPDKMQIQLTEIGAGQVYLNISCLKTKDVIYEGKSYDNCTTFKNEERNRDLKMPVVSFVVSGDKSLVMAPNINTGTSGQHGTLDSNGSVNSSEPPENNPVRSYIMKLLSVRNISFTDKFPFISTRVESQQNEEEEMMKDTPEVLWHLEQNTPTTEEAFSLSVIKHDSVSSDEACKFVPKFKNMSNIQCEQFLPFTCEEKSFFLMIYITHCVTKGSDHSWCTRYHIFPLDEIMGAK